MAIHLTPEASPTVQEGTLYVDSATGEFNVAGRTTPHIIPGVLYPAVAGKLLDGSTSHSGNYGTPQTQTGGDGRSYYYTDIKGSKPIKDPRIGGHFGSQRHKVRSIQLLEQETATHGTRVSAIDGREWMRFIGGDGTDTFNDSSGQAIHILNTGDAVEITGYFSDMNLSLYSGGSYDAYTLHIDGGSAVAKTNPAAAASPLSGRYVDPSSVFNVGLGVTLGIHTVKIIKNDPLYLYNVELIAQDTTSTANRSKIQIPSQDVVSYGKKFTVSDTPHYDPFNGFTNGTSLHSAFVDTATSLGLDTAPGSSAKWAISSTNNIRPYNGGRVVKWVDSSGVIKTSVNMMPPNAQNVAGSVAGTTEVTTPSATNTTPTPIFSDDPIDHSLSEVAKTFHYREFGNGAANAGTGGTYADASMLNTTDDIAYVMDDGLTSLSADDVTASAGGTLMDISGHADGDGMYITFIGTGVTITNTYNAGGTRSVVQNLPYGSHVLKYYREDVGGSTSNPDITIDGVNLGNPSWGNYNQLSEVTFHQPKKPPIPEDACVLADYMLMADFVKQTDAEASQISKGVRYNNGSRDHFYSGAASASALTVKGDSSPWGITGGGSPASTNTGVWKLPFFGTTGLSIMEQSQQAHSVKLDGSATTETALDNSVQAQGDMMSIAETVALGQTSIETTLITGTYHFFGHLVATPIHTSHHYQTFETPFLHELVGGDRNMEQTNLVVSPDGKTWDEVTRDTSYIGNLVLNVTDEDGANGDPIILDDYRGSFNSGHQDAHQKDFAIAYNRYICLKTGTYSINFASRNNISTTAGIAINGVNVMIEVVTDGSHFATSWSGLLHRGDYVQIKGKFWDHTNANFEIIKL
jgi:hypothetical protein